MGEFNSYVDRLKKLVTDTPPDELQEKVYTCFANGCLLLTAFLQLKGKDGWSATLINDYGQPILSFKEQAAVENTVKSAPWLREFLEVTANGKGIQKGGAAEPQLNSEGSSFVQTIVDTASQLTGDDVSLDLMLEKFLKKTQEMDDFWSAFGGHAKKIMDIDIPVPLPPAGIPVPVPLTPIVYFLMLLLDSFRISRALLGNKDIPLTILVLMEEIITGQWRQAILTSVGFISPSGVAIGTIGKYFVNAWLLVNPKIRNEIIKDVFGGGKSFIIGFILWCSSVLPPQAIKFGLEESITRLRDMVANIDDKMKDLSDRASEPLSKIKKRLVFPGFDLSKLKRISLSDIQNLQELSQWPVIVCSAEFQDIKKNLEKDPLFRLVMEMAGVPTTSQDTFNVCKRSDGFLPLSSVVSEAMTPVIEDIPGETLGLALPSSLTTTSSPPLPLPLPQQPEQQQPQRTKAVGGRRKTRKSLNLHINKRM
jgi:hypothetical protein